MSYARLLGEWLALLVGAALFVVLAVAGDWMQRIDATLLDHTSDLLLTQPSDEIVIVEIDDRSISEFGNWPWSRGRHAALLDSLDRYAPDRVLYDILFIEPTDPGSDQELAEAIQASDKVILAHTFGPEPNSVDGLVPVLPFEPFANGAHASGHVAVSADKDGIVRRFSMTVDADGQQWPHMAAVALEGVLPDSELKEISAGSPIVPMHANGAFRTVSAADVIARTTPPEYLAGKIILIGATAQGLGDRYAVAEHAGSLMPGVEIQANLLSSLLLDETILPAPTIGAQLFLVLVLIGLFIAWWKLPPAWILRVTVLTLAGLLGLFLGLIVFAQLWLPVASAIVAIMVAYPIWGWRRLSAVSRFLDAEAMRLGADGSERTAIGFDRLAKQVSLVSSLVGETKNRLSFLARVLEASPDPMMVFDKHGELVLLNQEAENLFGPEGSAKGSHLAEVLYSQRAALDLEKNEVIFADGRTFLFSRSQYDEASRTQIIALRDVTTLRQNEKERAAMLEFLSHDMRSPQVAIVGLSNGKGFAIDEKERFRRIEDQARRTLKLTDDFVQIARLEHNGISLEETDIGALLYEAMDRAYTEARRKRISFETEITDDPEFCFVDPLALSRCIDNLIGNALKFSPPETSITISLSREDSDAILIGIADQGPGLPEERLEEPFARFGAHDTKAGPSAGLGLAYVKRVVDEHMGQIDVHSSAKTGTTFQLRIPCARNCSI